MSYRKLEIWERARKVSIAVHKMTLTELPKFEMYKEGSQIRRSSNCSFRQLNATSDQQPATSSK